MNDEGLGRGKRRRVETQKYAAFNAASKFKDVKAKERARKRIEQAQTQDQVDELAALFERVGVDTTEIDLANAFTGMRMGGRRKKTKKRSKKQRRKTRRN